VDSLPLHIYKKWDIFVNGGWSGNSGPQEEDDCLRDKRDYKEYISKIKFKSWAALDATDESWLFQNDELIFKCTIVYSETIGGNTVGKKLTKIFIVDDKKLWNWYNWSKVPTSTFVSVTDILHWEPDKIAKKMKYVWLELDDDGQKFTTSIELPSSSIDIAGVSFSTPKVSVGYEYTPKDDKLGEALVSYCDNSAWPGHKYSTGMLNFWVGD
jgi:hypothetical protein